MSHINLLPWRETLRQRQKKNYLTILVALALGVISLMFVAGMVVDNLIAEQKNRNQYLEQEIAIVDKEIEHIKDIQQSKQAIEQRMALIEQLEVSRNAAPKVLDELVRLVPNGVSFSSISRSGNHLEVLGISDSNNRLADFMRRLEASDVFSSGDLSSIVADTSASDAVSDFKLTFDISPLVAPDFSGQPGAVKK
ncbi:MAG: type IV pilus assembly protein PilN [Paraglaciecola sp.]